MCAVTWSGWGKKLLSTESAEAEQSTKDSQGTKHWGGGYGGYNNGWGNGWGNGWNNYGGGYNYGGYNGEQAR